MLSTARTSTLAQTRHPARLAPAVLLRRLKDILPAIAIGCLILAVWYVGAVIKNMPSARILLGSRATTADLIRQSLNLNMPLVPLPHQVIADFASALAQPLDSPRGLWIHMGTTAWEALLGLFFGTAFGIFIASVFVHSRPMENAFLPFVVASQTVPVIALAPIVIGIMGISLSAKVLIAAYLVFFPVTVSMVKGFKSADPLALDVMRTYAATPWQVYRKLRFPAALPFLFAGLKVAATASLVGSIIAELPFGSTTGLGARLIVATTYSATISVWSTILACGVLGMLAFGLVSGLERLVVKRRVSLDGSV
jgi:NitT/TauT family transport system permease protein